MSVAKSIEISAQSKESFEDAIKKGVGRATSNLQDVTGAWIKEQKVDIENGKISAFRVNMKVTFILRES